MKTQDQASKTNIFSQNNSERSNATSQSIFHQYFEQKCFPDAFLFGLPSFVIVMSYYLVIFFNMQKLPHAEGLTFSDPIHKKVREI
jgi:hypothetical protein